MACSVRRARIARAQELASDHPASAEVLSCLVEIMRSGDELQVTVEGASRNGCPGFVDPIAVEVIAKFPAFLNMIKTKGPVVLAKEAHEAGKLSDGERRELLNAFWTGTEAATKLVGPTEFLARAFLQPYAEFVRGWSGKQNKEWMPRVCPYCLRKPGLGVLRPLGDGGQRFLVCSFCFGEWEFRRIVCAGCGEEDETKHAVYVAEEFSHVRVECCDSCRCYMKTIDLTRNGLADPVVDEMAAIPLDLWAQEKGYSKLQTNLMML